MIPDGERLENKAASLVVLMSKFAGIFHEPGSGVPKAIPLPPKTAVQSPQSAEDPSVRDRHIAEIETKGRMAWQKSTGYNRRSRIETLMGRWKTVIGTKLKSRDFDNQTTEAKIGVRALNQMTGLGRPEFKRVA